MTNDGKNSINMTTEEIKSLIGQRRRQLLVHSVIYYKLNSSIISDHQWAKWAIELEELQKKYPKESSEVEWYEAFKGFDHSTGFNLPLDNPWAVGTAKWLLKMCSQK